MLTNIERKGSDGVFMFTAGGNYEAPIMLLPELWTKENMPLNGNFVTAIPSRDILLVTGSDDKAGIKKLKDAIEQTVETSSYKISKNLYKWTGNKFEKFDP